MNLHRLPHEVQRAIETHGPTSKKLEKFLAEWRQDVEARNSLNNWVMSPQDRAFVDFHNHYLQERQAD